MNRCDAATRRIAASVIFISLAIFTVGCDITTQPASQPTQGLPTTTMHLGNGSFVIEVANTDPVREFGLMKRDSMPDDHGMIFVFADETPRSFWMKNTRIPLDIAYLDHDGKVVSIKQMKAYDLTSVPSDKPAKYAIELNLGTANKAGLKVGDRVEIPAAAKDTKE